MVKASNPYSVYFWPLLSALGLWQSETSQEPPFGAVLHRAPLRLGAGDQDKAHREAAGD